MPLKLRVMNKILIARDICSKRLLEDAVSDIADFIVSMFGKAMWQRLIRSIVNIKSGTAASLGLTPPRGLRELLTEDAHQTPSLGLPTHESSYLQRKCLSLAA